MKKTKHNSQHVILMDDYDGRNLRHILADSSKEKKYLYLENRLSMKGLFSVFLVEHKNKIVSESGDFSEAISIYNAIDK